MNDLLAGISLSVGGTELPNRYVMGSMHTGLEGDPNRFDELAEFYAARAKGGVGLIVTGGYAPNFAGRMKDKPCAFDAEELVDAHKKITTAVHREGGKILLQILHAGRYGYHSSIVAPSAIKSPINRDKPRELSEEEIEHTVQDYAKTARLAMEAGYDGVEVMGSEGYLISQFLAPRTNHRTDAWGGVLENRARFPMEVVKSVKKELGKSSILSYRISATDLMDGGLEPEEIIWLAKELEMSGVDCFGTGIGWHESLVPTIAAVVPHAAFADSIHQIKKAVSVPVIASNRINLPSTVESLLVAGKADLISMARPFLADPDFVNKALNGDADKISVCIGCNQACLDHYFVNKTISCLVNPKVMREQVFASSSTGIARKVAVVGGGVAGVSAALEAARNGHEVTLFEARDSLGGQFILAAKVPGKSDYGRYIEAVGSQLRSGRITLCLSQAVGASDLANNGFEAVIVATGIAPRELDILGNDNPKVVGYEDVLNGNAEVGGKVLIIGAGGIGHDVALFISHMDSPDISELDAFEKQWGIGRERDPQKSCREITMLKRSEGPFGKTLGKSTGWILRQELKDFSVDQIDGVTYRKIDEQGLHVEVGDESKILPADTIVVCAGQESENSLVKELENTGLSVHVIGGAKFAGELDAKRAISEGVQIANAL